ncbi:Shufflon protein B, partial [Salmonella enterica]|nr:Shufflon protein B [Salmonella enterica]
NGRTILSYQADQSDMIYNPGGHLQGHHSGMAHYYHTDSREVRPKNIAFNYIVKAG